jgi:hypothetical protein
MELNDSDHFVILRKIDTSKAILEEFTTYFMISEYFNSSSTENLKATLRQYFKTGDMI